MHTQQCGSSRITVKSNLILQTAGLTWQIVYRHGPDTLVTESWTKYEMLKLVEPPQDMETAARAKNKYFKPPYKLAIKLINFGQIINSLTAI
jgi:hypothetical protein